MNRPIFLIDYCIETYDIFRLIGDFNVSMENTSMNSFCNLNGLKSLITAPTCLQNLNEPSCMGLILTNTPNFFIIVLLSRMVFLIFIR